MSCMHGIVVPVPFHILTSTCLYFRRKAVIRIEMELAEDEQSDDSKSEKEDEDPNLQCHIQKMNDFRDSYSRKPRAKFLMLR